MSEILQGTTPILAIKISTSDFLVTDVIKLELVMINGETSNTYDLDDVTVDSTENSFIYQFTETETLAMKPGRTLYYQMRFMFANGTIVGTKPMTLQVANLFSEEVMTE